jgi:hypothetical protein
MKALRVVNGGGLPAHPAELLKDTVTPDGQRRYCTYPFRLFGIASDILKPCTWLRQVAGVNVLPVQGSGAALQDIWRSQIFDNVRRSIARGDYQHCNLEFCPEYKGEQKYFFTLEQLRTAYPAIADYVSGKTHVYMGGPELVNIAYDTGCNLSCPSCNRQQLPKLPRPQVAGFTDSLNQFADDVQYLFLAGMGDPFGTPHYYDWLCNVDVKRFKQLKGILLNTNGIMWNERTWNAIPAATRAMIESAVISIDGASPETFEVNRYPAKWSELTANLQFIASLRRRGELKVLRAYFVYQANNYHEMPSMVELCRQHAFDLVFFARIANWRSIPQAQYDALDVVNPRHGSHQDYLRVAARTSAMTSSDLQVVVMH